MVEALHRAEQHPVPRLVKKAQLNWRPKLLKATSLGMVTVPEPQELPPSPPPTPARTAEYARAERETTPSEIAAAETTQHTEIQWLLLKLGSEMGLDVWVARNDRSRAVNGHRLTDLPRIKDQLPLQFDEATTRTIQLIDVLWLRGNAIVAAFEVESTTSIYSGLLRMSDLLSMQPNLNIPLYLVAPDERRKKVLEEVNRPTFSRLSPPLHQMCRFIPCSALRERMHQLGPMVKYLRPEFVEKELSEPCALVDI